MSRHSVVVSLLALAALSCSGGGGPAPAAEVPDPDLGHLEPQVAEKMRQARQAVLDDPLAAAAWGELGAVYDAHLLADLAEYCYRRAHTLEPAEFRWVYLLGVVREINGAGADELIDLFGRAAALEPTYAATHLRLGDGLGRRGRYEEARRALSLALELAPGTALAHRRLGQVLLQQGELEQARTHLLRAVELEPQDLAAHTALAQAYARSGDAARAKETLERARGLESVNAIDDPVHASEVVARNVGSEHLFGEAVRRIQAGQYEEAVLALEVVVSASPENPSAHYWLGTAQRGMGREAQALAELTLAVQLQPRMNAARVLLADMLASVGNTRDAAEHYRQALRYAPGDAAIAERLSRLEARNP